MEPSAPHIESLLARAGDFIETKTELWKLKITDKTSETASSLLCYMIIIIAVGAFLLILSVAFALLLGEWLGKSYYGFFVIAGFYGIAGLLLYVYRERWIRIPFYNAFIRSILNRA